MPCAYVTLVVAILLLNGDGRCELCVVAVGIRFDLMHTKNKFSLKCRIQYSQAVFFRYHPGASSSLSVFPLDSIATRQQFNTHKHTLLIWLEYLEIFDGSTTATITKAGER